MKTRKELGRELEKHDEKGLGKKPKGCRKMFSKKGKWKSDRLIVGKCGDAIGLCPECNGDFPIETKITTKRLKEYYNRVKDKEGTSNLSQKLFTQKDGKKFVYADEIRKAIRKLKEYFRDKGNEYSEFSGIYADAIHQIDKIFGEELSK